MSTMIQIRHVPSELHSRLKSQAALAQMSLSDFILAELKLIAEKPTNQEMLERLRRRRPVKSSISAAQIIREERDRR
jgi:hypothetical protein